MHDVILFAVFFFEGVPNTSGALYIETTVSIEEKPNWIRKVIAQLRANA